MKILHIIPNLLKGGAERICLDMCNELENSGHQVKLVILDNQNSYEKLVNQLEIIHLDIHIQLKFLRKPETSIGPLQDLVNEFQPDIIHSHLFLAELYAQHIVSPAKRFCHVHDNMHQLHKKRWRHSFTKQGLVGQFERHYYLKLSKKKKTNFLCISQDAFDFISHNIPQKNGVPIFFPNAINSSLFCPQQKKETDTLQLVNIGSFVPKKGQELLLNMMKVLLGTKKVHLHFLGDGETKKDCQALSKKLGIENHITFHGIHDHPEEILQQADLYIHSASYEPFGLVLIEAMSTGLPVIATDGRGNRDFMDGSNGILLYHRDPKLFAQEIIDLMNDQERYKKLQAGALETAKKYDIVPYVERLVELYQKAIDEEKR